MANGNYEITYDALNQVIMLVSGGRPVDGMELHYTIVGIGSYSVQMEKSKYSSEAIRELAQAEAQKHIKTLKG